VDPVPEAYVPATQGWHVDPFAAPTALE
jgi:hypothetical protein